MWILRLAIELNAPLLKLHVKSPGTTTGASTSFCPTRLLQQHQFDGLVVLRRTQSGEVED
ncbi:hypothetical protein ACFL5M_00930 [Candidatus Neomarinimicrobiota bacterium]